MEERGGENDEKKAYREDLSCIPLAFDDMRSGNAQGCASLTYEGQSDDGLDAGHAEIVLDAADTI